MISAQEFYEEVSKTRVDVQSGCCESSAYTSMNSWTVAMWKLAMKFAEAYADRRELEVR